MSCFLSAMEVCGHFVPQDGLLDEQHGAAGFLNLFDQVEDVSPLLTEHTVHLSVVRHHNLIVHLSQQEHRTNTFKQSRLNIPLLNKFFILRCI